MRTQIAIRHPEDLNEKAIENINNLPRSNRKRVVKFINSMSMKRRPGILDRISSCESREAASLMWHEFLDSSNGVSSKTKNKAERLLETLDFPQA